jgi:transaldolase
MKIYLDSGNLEEIRDVSTFIDGLTTNPSLLQLKGATIEKMAQEICALVPYSVSLEVIATDYEGMMAESLKLAAIAPQVVVKLPMTWDGLRVCRKLSERNIKTNVTLCFSVTQALMAAKAGATYVSPFLGRLDDIGQSGIGLIRDIKTAFGNYSRLTTQILAASIRSVEHITQVAVIGVHAATIPYKLVKAMVEHDLTTSGLQKFLTDAKASGYKI